MNFTPFSANTLKNCIDSLKLTWNEIKYDLDSSPRCRENATLTYHYSYIYLIGGRFNHTAAKDVWRFCMKTNKWQKVTICGGLPLIDFHTSCSCGDMLYLFGGHHGRNSTATFRKGRFEYSDYLLPNYKQHSAVVYNDAIYVFGGWTEILGLSNTLWKYDTTVKTFSTVEPLSEKTPLPRYGHSAVIHRNCMWIVGGIDNNFSVCPDVWKYDFSARFWREESTKPFPIYSHCAVTVENCMVIMGGKNGDESYNYNVWQFSFDTPSWTNLGSVEHYAGYHFVVRQLLIAADFIDAETNARQSFSNEPMSKPFEVEDPNSKTTNRSKLSKLKNCVQLNKTVRRVLPENQIIGRLQNKNDKPELIEMKDLSFFRPVHAKMEENKRKSMKRLFVFGEILNETKYKYKIFSINVK